MAENLEGLEKRLQDLEMKVFGERDKDIEYPKHTEQMCSSLIQMNSHVDSAIAGRPKIQAFMKKLGELERLLEPSYTDRLTLSDDSKTDLILAEEDAIRNQCKHLEQVRDLSTVLSSEHLKVTPAQSEKLQSLSQVHIKQQDATGELSEDVKNIFLQYNSIINLLSKQFSQWEQEITKLEVSRMKKPVD